MRLSLSLVAKSNIPLRGDPKTHFCHLELKNTRLWTALQNASGGLWGGCVYDVDAIIKKLNG
jgi:hypothetical protein